MKKKITDGQWLRRKLERMSERELREELRGIGCISEADRIRSKKGLRNELAYHWLFHPSLRPSR